MHVLGVPVLSADVAGALGEVERAVEQEPPARVVFVNAHTLNLSVGDARFHDVLASSSVVLNDGAGLQLAARLQGARFPANLNGSDFSPRLLQLAAGHGWPVFFLGAAEGVATQAAERLRAAIPGLQVAGTRSGYFAAEQGREVAEEVRATGAQMLVVGMGNPRQELWLADHLDETGARLGVGVGAFLDFAAGRVRRAPPWLSSAGLEWTHRLALEPGRLWRRYLVGNPLFLARVLRDRPKCDSPIT